MPYTNNVPQSNQTIASTTDPIRDNFAFLQTDLRAEHSFNGNSGAAEGSHLQASMPNLALDPAVLPTGTNGMYYVKDGNARFYDGTTISKLTDGNAAVNGYQWIGRVLLQWGFNASTGSTSLTYPIPFPTAAFSVTLGSVGGPAFNTYKILSKDRLGFSVQTNNVGSGFYWMAIGN